MKSNPTLEQVIRLARALKWCLKHQCTTCGAHQFRATLKVFTRDQLIAELKTLSEKCVTDTRNRRALLLIMYEMVFFEDFTGLSSELAGSTAGEFLDRAIRIEQERRLNTQIRVEKEQHEKKIKAQKNAQKNIWGAIKRKDMNAISHLLSKNLDLNEIGSAGLSLSAVLVHNL